MARLEVLMAGDITFKSVLFALLALLTACGRPGPPYSPEKALKTIRVENGFRIELFASEPMVTSPVAMDFDENGRIFVVEMPGYPLDTRPTGRVKLLEDTNGDGRPDRSSVFADGLVLPTGVMRWRKGVLVTAAPDLWYLEDSDGDGRADSRRKVLTGFAFTNPQHMVNGPIYGLDNWIYLAHEGPVEAVFFKEKFGDPGGEIRFADRTTASLKNGRFNVRFRPDTHQLEALSGWSQFGQAFDEWGHHFMLDNINHVRHEVIAARYLQHNPDLLLSSAMQGVSDHGDAGNVFSITQDSNSDDQTNVGQITSACSLTFYLGGGFPPDFTQVSFVAEPVHNLVHRDVWSESGSTYVARRAADGMEFLASTDPWFRPVNFTIGPDGALYLVDYYRQVIEHPEWSLHLHHSKQLYSGSDKGRIYRIIPNTQLSLVLPGSIRLSHATDQELVGQLANPNLWWRRTAQRLLVDRKSVQAVEPLVRLFKESSSPLARLHALWTLEGLGKLQPTLVQEALADSEAGVRENAIRLAEPLLAGSPTLIEKLLRMVPDASPKVRFQLLCTLGFINSPQAKKAQKRLLTGNIEDPWMQVAALSAGSDRALSFFQMAAAPQEGLISNPTKGRTDFFRQVCSVIGARQNEKEMSQVLTTVARNLNTGSQWWCAASVDGLARGARARTAETPALKASLFLLLQLFESHLAPVRHASLELLKVVGPLHSRSVTMALRRAEAIVKDKRADSESRADAMGLLALEKSESREPLFKELLVPQEPEAVQAAAVRALSLIKGVEIGAFLLSKWKTLTPLVRTETINALLLEPDRTRLLLNAVKDEQIQAWTLSSWNYPLLWNKDPAIRQLAMALLAQKPGEREKILKQYEAALNMNGDGARGEQVFKRICSKCHKMNGVGTAVGPDLGTVRNRPASSLLSDILMPSRSIAQNYETYVVERLSGGIIDGVLGGQTPTTITLRREEGEETVIPRKDIKSMYIGDLSAMPGDLDKQIDVQQMADLLRFLKTAR